MTRKHVLLNLTCLGVFLIAGGILSAVLKYELLFDFIQYHYYNGFAFLNDRLMTDIAASALPNYYNPLLDSLYFLLNQIFKENITLYYFITGFPFGVMMFMFFKITQLFFDPRTIKGKISIAACLLIALTGFNVWFQIGTSTHEILISIFIIGSTYLFLKFPEKALTYFVSGFLLGSAAGLKLTAALYCISAGITLILLYKSLDRPKTYIILLMIGGGIGFATTNGFWCLTLWKFFKNPFFPFWNEIFKSPYYLDYTYVDELHLYHLQWHQRLLLPFYLILHPHDSNIGVSADLSDFRFAFMFIIGIIWLVLRLLNKTSSMTSTMRFFSLWLLVSYLVWLIFSANLRFTIPIETGGAIIFVYTAGLFKISGNIFKEIFLLSFLFILTGILLLTPSLSYKWGNRRTGYLLQEKVNLPPETLLITIGMPIAAFATEITEQNKRTRILGFTDVYSGDPWRKWDIARYGKMKEKTNELIKAFPSKVILIVKYFYQENAHLLNLLPFDTKNWNCRTIKTTPDVFRLFVGSGLTFPELCYPPEMKDKIIITK